MYSFSQSRAYNLLFNSELYASQFFHAYQKRSHFTFNICVTLLPIMSNPACVIGIKLLNDRSIQLSIMYNVQ